MKKLNRLFAAFLLLMGVASAQTILTNTTLSSKAGATDTSVVVASATGITAPSTSDPTKNTILYVDREAMQVTSVSGTTIGVIRGVESTAGRGHASSAVVFVIPVYADTYSGTPYGYPPAVPAGSCTRANELVLPRIQFVSGLISDCVGGQWVTGDALGTTRGSGHYLQMPIAGSVSSATALGTSTATVAAELYCTEIDMPFSKLVTGMAVHAGATGNGTDLWIYALYDSAGTLMANTAVAGTAVPSTNYAWDRIALTTPYYVVGPAQYYGCVMSNGTGDYYDLIKTNYGDLEYTYKSGSAGTFGTLPNFTAPTQFTTVNGPWLYLY